jgi:ubiquinone/menaquinone biosynthesis C-methylase UbiE
MFAMFGRQKGHKGIGMEGVVATWYAKNTAGDRDSFAQHARSVVQNVPADGRILEVAPGPGYLAVEMARLGDYRIVGLDISHSFVRMAGDHARALGFDIDFRQGNAAAMPFADASFDFIVCRAAFKNFSEPVKALNEMHRVLKPGGQALIIDLRKDVSNDEIAQYVDSRGGGRFNALIMTLTFRHMLRPRAYTKGDFAEMLGKTAFRQYEIKEESIGMEVWLRKA